MESITEPEIPQGSHTRLYAKCCLTPIHRDQNMFSQYRPSYDSSLVINIYRYKIKAVISHPLKINRF